MIRSRLLFRRNEKLPVVARTFTGFFPAPTQNQKYLPGKRLSALVLGLTASLLSFIPNFEPIKALVSDVMNALLEGPQALYVSVQAVESKRIQPLVQKKIEIPPALIIVGQQLLETFSGILGLISATPIMVIVMVLVKMLYILGTLRDDSVQVG